MDRDHADAGQQPRIHPSTLSARVRAGKVHLDDLNEARKAAMRRANPVGRVEVALASDSNRMMPFCAASALTARSSAIQCPLEPVADLPA